MSILIKGMEMPKSCILEHGLVCEHLIHCDVADAKYRAIDARPKDCPLVEIPEPHGRLIDADALSKKAYHRQTLTTVADMLNDIKAAPTVIEAEGDKHE